MMASMSLYGGDHRNANAATSAYHPGHPLHHAVARNQVELGARSLPRPRRKHRKKREKEQPLYPSVAAVEEAVPEAIISVQDNGTLDIRYDNKKAANPGDDNNDAEECMEEEEDDEESAFNSTYSSNSNSSNNDSNSNRPRSWKARRRRSSSSNSSASSEKQLNQEFKKLSVKRKPVASAPWPMDDDYSDDPLGGTILTLAPRRKVFRHASRDSHRSTGSRSTESGDSVGSHSRRHRRTATFDSMDQWQQPQASIKNDKGTSNYHKGNHLKKGSDKYNSKTSKGNSRSSTGSALTTTKSSMSTATTTSSNYYTKNSPPHHHHSHNSKKTKTPLRRMKSWHDDETKAEQRAQELEIEPGLCLPLRGSDETLAAIRTGFVEEIFCQACDTELICIADASFCVCPECKCVSPVDGIASLTNHKSAGSVGLGLRASSTTATISANTTRNHNKR